MLDDTIEFIESCFNRDMILSVLLGYSARWFASRMALIVGRGWVQLFASAGFEIAAETPRDARRAAVEEDAVALSEESSLGTPAELGLSNVFSQLGIEPSLVYSIGITIGARIAVVLVGADARATPNLTELQAVAQTAGTQLETVIRLTKSGELPEVQIPPLPTGRVSHDEVSSPDGAPQMTLDASADDSMEDGVESSSSTSFGLPFVRPSGEEVSSTPESAVVEPDFSDFSELSALSSDADLAEPSAGRPKGTKTVSLPEVSETSLGAPNAPDGLSNVSSTLVGGPHAADQSDDDVFSPPVLERPADSAAEESSAAAEPSEAELQEQSDSSGVLMVPPIAVVAEGSFRTQLGVAPAAHLKPARAEVTPRAEVTRKTNLGGIAVTPEPQPPAATTAPGSMILRHSKKLQAVGRAARRATPAVMDAVDDQPEPPASSEPSLEVESSVIEPPEPENAPEFDLDSEPEVASPTPEPEEELDAFFDFFAEPSNPATSASSEARIVSLSEVSKEPRSLPPETLDRILDSGPEMVDTQEMYLSLDSHDSARAFEAAEQVAALGPKALDVLEVMFPGRIFLDRYQHRDDLPPVERHGAVLDALVRIGEPSLRVAERYLDDSSIEARFYAVLLLTKLDATTLLPNLVERLFDRDQQIRHVASDIVRLYQSLPQFNDVIDRLHKELTSENDLHATVATEVLAVLRLRSSVSELIEAMDAGTNNRVKAKIREALQTITLHDWSSPYEWRQWWAKARTQPREEWIAEGLDAMSDKIRQQAFEEVQRLPGLKLNYHPDQPSKLRQRSQAALREWIANRSGVPQD